MNTFYPYMFVLYIQCHGRRCVCYQVPSTGITAVMKEDHGDESPFMIVCFI